MRKVALLLACLIILQSLLGTLTASADCPYGCRDGGVANPGYTPAIGSAPSYYPYPTRANWSACNTEYYNTYTSGYYDPCSICSFISTCPPYVPIPYWWEYPYYPGGCCTE
jgi:hypothetical protein